MSLRKFHLFFILIAIAAADLFGGWSIGYYQAHHDVPILILGLLTIAGGLGLVFYAIWFVKELDRMQQS